ncbi:MAG: hypothetical protein ACYC6H_03075 [Bellilinea sp.]
MHELERHFQALPHHLLENVVELSNPVGQIAPDAAEVMRWEELKSLIGAARRFDHTHILSKIANVHFAARSGIKKGSSRLELPFGMNISY